MGRLRRHGPVSRDNLLGIRRFRPILCQLQDDRHTCSHVFHSTPKLSIKFIDGGLANHVRSERLTGRLNLTALGSPLKANLYDTGGAGFRTVARST